MMKQLMMALALLLTLTNCSVGQPEVKYGQDECAYCRMNVVDAKFAAALQTTKGRTYVFDAPECMVPFVGPKGHLVPEEVAGWYVSDFAHPGQLIDAAQAFYLHSPELKSPMRGNVAAFASEADREEARQHFPGDVLDWSQVKKLFANE